MRLSQGPSAELKATPFCLSQYGTLRHPDAKNLHSGHGDTYVRCSTPATVYTSREGPSVRQVAMSNVTGQLSPSESWCQKPSPASLSQARSHQESWEGGCPGNEMQRQHGACPGRGREGTNLLG